MKLPELKKLMKDKNIKGISYLNKNEIIQRLIEYKVLPEDYVDRQPKVKVKDNGDKYRIRNNPRPVEIFDRETGETVTFPFMYKAGRSLDKSARLMDAYDGKMMEGQIRDKGTIELISNIFSYISHIRKYNFF